MNRFPFGRRFWASAFALLALALVADQWRVRGRAELVAEAAGASDEHLPLPAVEVPRRLLVLAPHPDDVLLAAGLIQRTLAAGGEARVVDLTCGDGKSPFAIRFLKRKGFREDPNDAINYGLYRPTEDQKSVADLGLNPSKHLTFLGYPDGGLWEILQRSKKENPEAYRSGNTGAEAVPYANALRPGAPYTGDSILTDLASVLSEFKPDLLVLPHPNDHHRDHAATWYFGTEALALLPELIPTTRVLVPFDFHSGDLPHSLKRKFRMRPTRETPSPTNWQELELSPAEYEAKLLATSRYTSQMAWEHPFLPEYQGHISYMYGYVARNELFGEVQSVIHDEGFRRSIEMKALPARVGAVIGNVFTDLGRHLFGK